MSDGTTEEKVALMKNIIIIIVLLWILSFTFLLFLDGFQIFRFDPGKPFDHFNGNGP